MNCPHVDSTWSVKAVSMTYILYAGVHGLQDADDQPMNASNRTKNDYNVFEIDL